MRPARRDFRDGRNYALAALSEIAAPLLRCAARGVVRAPATLPSEWRRGLILGNGHIGDVLYRTASLEALARGLPDCEWFYLSTPPAAELLETNPALARVLPWMTGADPASALERHRAPLRALRFDVVLCTENVRTHAALLTALRIGAPNRVAFTQKGFSGLVTHGVQLEHPVPRPVQIQTLVSAITGAKPDGEPRPRVYSTGDDAAAAAAEWARLGADDSTSVLACSVTTRQSIGAFPPQVFASILARTLRRDDHLRVVLFGSASDAPILVELARELGPRAVVSAGRLTLRAAVAFLARCDAFLGSDSGPRHMANAAGIPVFFIRNLGTSEIEAGRYVDTEHDLAPPGQFLSPEQACERLRAIDPDVVATQILAAAMRARGRPVNTLR